MIKTIIIDDEPSAVSVLSMLLKNKFPNEIEIIATTNSPVEGKELIEKLNPDLVFLDIEMPGMTGIELVRSFNNPSFRIVFVTAYDDYAVEAFKLCAIDYLLKPVGPDSVVATVEKVKSDISKNNTGAINALQELQRILTKDTGPTEKIGISSADKILFLNISEIMYCEAQGGYTNVFLQDGSKILSSKALGDFESQLGPNHFFRIHHSYLINLKRIREFQRNDGGYVIMENGKQLEVSQRKRKDFVQAISRFVV
jgi:two-component system, LytTR family, response regulator